MRVRIIDIDHRPAPGCGYMAARAFPQVVGVRRLFAMAYPTVGWFGMVSGIVQPTRGDMALRALPLVMG